MLERTLEGVLSLPFASPSALVLQHAQLPESREILVVAHRHHLGLTEAISQREGARADSIAREHARLSLTNLEIVLSHRGLLDEVPGAALLTLARPAAKRPSEPSRIRGDRTLLPRLDVLLAPRHRHAGGADDVLGTRPVGVLERAG